MTVHRNDAQWHRLLDRFYTGWEGAAWDCRDVGVSDSSFKRLVHQYRREYGQDFILDRWSDNRKFEGRHKLYRLNPDRMPAAAEGRKLFEQLTMQL